MQLSIFLPFLAFAAILTLVWGRGLASPGNALADWRRAFLRASVISGMLLVVMGEVLSLFRLLDRPAVAVFWLVVTAASSVWAWKSGAGAAVMRRLRQGAPSIPLSDRQLLGGMAVVVVLLWLVAWISPPSNVDSLLYHMARVVHWAQNHSLAHYPTIYTFQLSKPIWAELAILNLRLLWGNDQPAELVQWGSMLGSLIVVSWTAKLLGAGRRGQILAAVFALSIPMGILQSTSTQNDYVVAFWVAALLAVVAQVKAGRVDLADRAELAAIAGLGTLTKGTFPIYALPILLWYFVPMLWREKPKRWLLDGALVAGMVVLCNLGFWSRNLMTFGGPYGPSDWLRSRLTFLADPAVSPGDDGLNGEAELPLSLTLDLTPSAEPSAQPVQSVPGRPETQVPSDAGPEQRDTLSTIVLWPVGRWARYVAPNMVTPVAVTNAALWGVLEGMPNLFPRKNLEAMRGQAWNHEDSAGNPMQAALVVLTMILLFARAEGRAPLRAGMALATLAGFLLIPLVIGGGAAKWGLRYQLPFFVAWAPVFGWTMETWLRPRFAAVLGWGLLLVCVPYLLFNNTRPLIGAQPWPTRTPSILVADPAELAFAVMFGSSDPGKKDAFLSTAELIKTRACRQVGLRIDSSGLEYLYWWVLEAPQSGIALAILNPTPESARYADPDLDPCIVVCTVCRGETEIYGLPLITDFGGLSLYGAVE